MQSKSEKNQFSSGMPCACQVTKSMESLSMPSISISSVPHWRRDALPVLCVIPKGCSRSSVFTVDERMLWCGPPLHGLIQALFEDCGQFDDRSGDSSPLHPYPISACQFLVFVLSKNECIKYLMHTCILALHTFLSYTFFRDLFSCSEVYRLLKSCCFFLLLFL